MADPERAPKVLYDLRAWRLSLAIDDFGTAQPSPARLQNLPADHPKIDRSFVQGIDHDPWQQGQGFLFGRPVPAADLFTSLAPAPA